MGRRGVPLLIGRRLLHYQILEVLGQGAFGTVYKARDVDLGRLVAIKVLSAEHSGSDKERERFFREARAAASLNHPNVVHVYEIAETDGLCLIVMELIEGRTLDTAGGRISTREEISLALQIAECLAAADAQVIVHRD